MLLVVVHPINIAPNPAQPEETERTCEEERTVVGHSKLWNLEATTQLFFRYRHLLRYPPSLKHKQQTRGMEKSAEIR